MKEIKNLFIKECKKYGYELNWEEDDYLSFINPNVSEEYNVFGVNIDEDLERVSMAILMDLGSWNESTECDLNNKDEIIENINIWLDYNLNEIEKSFLESEAE